MNFNEEKLSKLKRADELFDERYGKSGTPSRMAFKERALNWYYSEILRDRRKELKITQKQLAEKVGKKREYIALLEKGVILIDSRLILCLNYLKMNGIF